MSKPPIEVPQGAIRLNTDSQKLEFFAQDQWWEMATDVPNLGGNGGPAGNPTGNSADQLASPRGTFSGGHNASPGYADRIDYINIATLGDATDFGNLTLGRSATGSVGSRTRGLHGGGYTGSNQDRIDFWTFSTTGDAVDFGNLNDARHWTQPTSSATRGVWAGGNNGGATNVIQYVTMASAGDTIDFGDMSFASAVNANSSAQSPTRGLLGGGTPGTTNTIEFITIASTGNSQDFGDYTKHTAREGRGSNSIRAVFGGGTRAEPSISNIID